jgi:hypothetical protein
MAALAMCVVLGLATPVSGAHAQLSPALTSLDEWVVMRFRGAGLLPDSGAQVASVVPHADAPRIDGVRSAARRDTLVAVHFDTVFWRPTLAVGANVRFADPSGEIAAIGGRVTARRAFRAPRKAGARPGNAADWRIGWAYLVAMPIRTANAAPSGFSGWSLVEVPPNAKRPAH